MCHHPTDSPYATALPERGRVPGTSEAYCRDAKRDFCCPDSSEHSQGRDCYFGHGRRGTRFGLILRRRLVNIGEAKRLSIEHLNIHLFWKNTRVHCIKENRILTMDGRCKSGNLTWGAGLQNRQAHDADDCVCPSGSYGMEPALDEQCPATMLCLCREHQRDAVTIRELNVVPAVWSS